MDSSAEVSITPGLHRSLHQFGLATEMFLGAGLKCACPLASGVSGLSGPGVFYLSLTLKRVTLSSQTSLKSEKSRIDVLMRLWHGQNGKARLPDASVHPVPDLPRVVFPELEWDAIRLRCGTDPTLKKLFDKTSSAKRRP